VRIFRKSVEKINFSVKPDNNNWHFTWRRVYIYGNVLPNLYDNENIFRQKS